MMRLVYVLAGACWCGALFSTNETTAWKFLFWVVVGAWLFVTALDIEKNK